MKPEENISPASANGGTSKGLPTYLVMDTSSSMKPYEQLLNDTLVEVFDTLLTSPKVSEFIHLSLISFNTQPHLVTGMTEIGDVTTLPTVSCNGLTNYAPMFRLLRERIEIDVPALSSAGTRVLRPVVFLLTDGDPRDASKEEWVNAHAELTDPGWRPHPHIITYGFGEASEETLRQVSTLTAYLADGNQENRSVLSSALSSLLNSLVASARTGQLQIPEEVKGYKSVPLDHVDF